MGAMPMAGAEVMSMWTRMPGQSWPGAAASFLGMWMLMMVPMMLPSLSPVLWRSRLTMGHAVVVGAAYYVVWGVVGVVAFPIGVAARLVFTPHPALQPLAIGVVIVIAGAYQLSRWKAHHLARCRLVPSPSDVRAAWRHGVRLGLHCNNCSLGFTAILMATGLMDVRAMVLVSALTAAERISPKGTNEYELESEPIPLKVSDFSAPSLDRAAGCRSQPPRAGC